MSIHTVSIHTMSIHTMPIHTVSIHTVSIHTWQSPDRVRRLGDATPPYSLPDPNEWLGREGGDSAAAPPLNGGR